MRIHPTTTVRLAGAVRPAGRKARIRVSRVAEIGGSAAVRYAVVRLSASRYRYRFGPVSDDSTYRAVARIAGHRDHAASWSRPLLFITGST
jgi:hypothetical protein